METDHMMDKVFQKSSNNKFPDENNTTFSTTKSNNNNNILTFEKEWEKMKVLEKLQILEQWHNLIKQHHSDVQILVTLAERIFVPWVSKVYPKTFLRVAPQSLLRLVKYSHDLEKNDFQINHTLTIAYNEKRDSRGASSTSTELYSNRQKLQDHLISFINSAKENPNIQITRNEYFSLIKNLYKKENSDWFAKLLILYFEQCCQKNKMDLLEERLTTTTTTTMNNNNNNVQTVENVNIIAQLIVKLDFLSLILCVVDRLHDLLEEEVPRRHPFKKTVLWIKLLAYIISSNEKHFSEREIKWFSSIVSVERLSECLAWLKIITFTISKEQKTFWLQAQKPIFLGMNLEKIDICSLLLLIEFFDYKDQSNFQIDASQTESFLLSFSSIFAKFVSNIDCCTVNGSSSIIPRKIIPISASSPHSSSSESITNQEIITTTTTISNSNNTNNNNANDEIQKQLRKWFWWQWADMKEILLILLDYWHKEQIVDVKQNLKGCISAIMPELLKGHEDFVLQMTMELYNSKYINACQNVPKHDDH